MGEQLGRSDRKKKDERRETFISLFPEETSSTQVMTGTAERRQERRMFLYLQAILPLHFFAVKRSINEPIDHSPAWGDFSQLERGGKKKERDRSEGTR